MNEASPDELDGIIRQKAMIEQMNRKKKALLGEALAKRRAKTTAEHAGLRRIEVGGRVGDPRRAAVLPCCATCSQTSRLSSCFGRGLGEAAAG